MVGDLPSIYAICCDLFVMTKKSANALTRFTFKPVIESILIIQWGSNPDEASANQIKVDKPMMRVELTPA
jgi:hypothetical protein